MTQLAHESGGKVTEGSGSEITPDWGYIADLYAQELQLEAGGEGEGWIDPLKLYIGEVVFDDKDAAVGLYTALAASPVPAVRLTATECLDKLWAIAPDEASRLLRTLMADSDDEIRHSAHHIATQYG